VKDEIVRRDSLRMRRRFSGSERPAAAQLDWARETKVGPRPKQRASWLVDGESSGRSSVVQGLAIKCGPDGTRRRPA